MSNEELFGLYDKIREVVRHPAPVHERVFGVSASPKNNLCDKRIVNNKQCACNLRLGACGGVQRDLNVREHCHSSMAAVVPFASCYPNVQSFGSGPRGCYYLSLLAYRGPRCAPRPRLAYHAPKMTLRQICHTLKVMKQIRTREAAAAAAARKQGSTGPGPESPSSKSEKKCVPSCLRRKRSIKRVG